MGKNNESKKVIKDFKWWENFYGKYIDKKITKEFFMLQTKEAGLIEKSELEISIEKVLNNLKSIPECKDEKKYAHVSYGDISLIIKILSEIKP